jgi:hypothetical protein
MTTEVGSVSKQFLARIVRELRLLAQTERR